MRWTSFVKAAILATGVAISACSAENTASPYPQSGEFAAPTPFAGQQAHFGTYGVTDLELEGTQATGALNNRGQVAATVRQTDMRRALLWRSGSWELLSDQRVGGAVSINDLGHVVGSVAQPEVSGYGIPFHAFLWSDGLLVDLGTAPGGGTGPNADIPYSVGLAINNRGDIAGQSTAPGGSFAAAWSGGQVRVLGTLPGAVPTPFPFSYASGINDRGDIVGMSDHESGYRHAVIWPRGGIIQDLGLPTDRTKGNTTARGINGQGEVVGDYQDGQGEVRALRWAQGEVFNLGGARPDDIGSIAHGINDQGQIVGYSVRPRSDETGWLWERGEMSELDALIDPADPLKPFLHIRSGLSINNRGQILVSANDSRIAPCDRFGCPTSLYLLTPMSGATAANSATPPLAE